MLTLYEEQILRGMAANSRPLPVMNSNHITGADTSNTALAEGQHIRRLFEKLGAPVLLAGPDHEQQNLARAPEDTEVIARIKHTMKKGEALTAWYARTGLGRAQLLTMTKSEISRFVTQADANNASGPVEPPRLPGGPKQQPRSAVHFVEVGD